MSRIRIISNLAISLDGKIASKIRERASLGTPEDRKMMGRIRRFSDAILMGATTLKHEKMGRGFGNERRLIIVISSKLTGFDAKWPLFKKINLKFIFISKVSNSKLARELPNAIFYQTKNPSITLHKITKDFRRFGLRTLLLEGGGKTMWEFFKRDAVDEIYLTLTPWIIGGESAPTLCDGEGFLPGQFLKFKLKSLRRHGSELFLRYQR